MILTKVHAQERAEARYNQELSKHDISRICDLIKHGQHIIVGRSSKNKKMEFAYVNYNHIPYKVLYKKSFGEVRIITMYPFDVEEYNRALDNRKIKNCIKFLKEHGYIVYKNWRLDE